ncbi:putative quinol monooxygenase [Kineococcus rhizosphaerae]|uniref:Quinol monooxygenase YgiN n=1 Tax=Kineococcus rhizosphaerae TaxID=559628 RepID=A0A2T0QZG5_9ACTN|nr:putative quinol monooxygenase [Kineococcus rhizosphaerae]PRY12080.1 quinol monooxygenase YgiN [Kineococcus rhizosphaerae]
MSTTVVADITPLPGHEDEVGHVLRAAVVRVRHEDAGCERYELNVDPRDGSYVMVERWADRAALDAHAAGPAFADLSAALEGLLARPIAVRALTPVG